MGQDKQRVALAAHYLSRQMADAIRILFPNDQKMQELAEFIEATDAWFDTLNSTGKTADKPLRHGYEVHLELQEDSLKSFKDTVLNLKVLNKDNKEKIQKNKKTSLMHFQKGIAICCTSMLHLYHYMVQEYGISYIQTARINQDALENLFSVLRSMGGTDNRMGALSFMQRLRNYILGAGNDLTVETAVVLQTEENDKLLTSEITKNLVEIIDDPVVQVNEDEENSIDDISTMFDSLDNVSTPNVVVSFPQPEAEMVDIEDWVEDECEVGEDEIGNNDVPEDQNLATEEGFNNYADHIGYTLMKKNKNVKRKVVERVVYDPDEYVESNWIKMKNRSGLQIPSKSFKEDVKKWDISFKEYHKNAEDGPNGLLRTDHVISNFADILINEFKDYPADLLKYFARSRTFFRMHHMKMHLKKLETARSKKQKVDLMD